MEAKNALHPDAMDTDNVNYERYNSNDQDDGDEEDFGAVHRDSLCNRCGGKGHFHSNYGTPDPEVRARAMARTARVALSKQAKGSSRDLHHLPVLQ